MDHDKLDVPADKVSQAKVDARSDDLDIASSNKWTTTRVELWSYYLYYVGNNGLSGFNFGPSQFQNLLFLAGYDPILGPGSTCGDNGCVLPYLGKIRDSMRLFEYLSEPSLTDNAFIISQLNCSAH